MAVLRSEQRWYLVVMLVGFVVACRADLLDPNRQIRFLAILATFEDGQLGPESRISYRVKEAQLNLDTTVTITPGDTVVLEVEEGYYQIEALDAPLNCLVRGRSQRWASVDDRTGTAIVRYKVRCKPPLTLVTRTLGSQLDESLVYRLWAGDTVAVGGRVFANDSLVVAGLKEGAYGLTLHHIASNCLVVSSGGPAQRVEVRKGGGVIARFDLRCSETASRPQFLEVASSYRDSVNAVYFRATDPQRDITDYFWDVTDCRGNSVLPEGGKRMAHLREDRTGRQDTITVVAAFEVGIPDDDLKGNCVSLRLQDLGYNSSEILQVPIDFSDGSPPTATTFNARLVGSTRLVVDLEARDPDGDFAGTFAALRLRDGTLDYHDGDWDFGIYNTVGYLSTSLPELQLLALRYVQPMDVIGCIVYLIDRTGHFSRFEDRNTFR